MPPALTHSHPNAFHVWDQDDIIIPMTPEHESPLPSPLMTVSHYIPSFFPGSISLGSPSHSRPIPKESDAWRTQRINLLLLSFFSSFLSCLKHLSKPALESPYLSGNTQVVWLTRPVCMHGFPSLGAADVYSTKTGTDYCTFPAVLSSRRACDTLFNSLHLLWICAKLSSWLYLFLLPVVMSS